MQIFVTKFFNINEIIPPLKYNTITYTININENDVYINIGELKNKIEIKTGFLAKEMRFIFNGKQLCDDYCLDHYGITNFSTIHWFQRLRGD